jgi:hypothetical protein
MSEFFKIGGGATTTPGNIRIGNSVPSNTQYRTFGTGLVDFQVTTGKTFYITKIILSGSTATQLEIGYGDVATSGSQASAPTGAVDLTPQSNGFNSPANTSTTFDVVIPIPSDKYPYAKSVSGTQGVFIMGIEI